MGSAAALLVVRPARTAVICALEESRKAFGGMAPFPGVLVESAVGFAPENLSWLRFWGISVHEAADVTGPAWIRFSWPIPAMIRDFGRICPVSGGTVIARLGDIPVAVRNGSLIVLGSPLGPHIYAGDRDAHDLLAAFRKASS